LIQELLFPELGPLLINAIFLDHSGDAQTRLRPLHHDEKSRPFRHPTSQTIHTTATKRYKDSKATRTSHNKDTGGQHPSNVGPSLSGGTRSGCLKSGNGRGWWWDVSWRWYRQYGSLICLQLTCRWPWAWNTKR